MIIAALISLIVGICLFLMIYNKLAEISARLEAPCIYYQKLLHEQKLAKQAAQQQQNEKPDAA